MSVNNKNIYILVFLVCNYIALTNKTTATPSQIITAYSSFSLFNTFNITFLTVSTYPQDDIYSIYL